MPESDAGSVIPAQLSFLAIYNPTLGPTDETIEDQIVFYTSRSDYLHRTEGSPTEEEGIKPPEDGKNERLRQIGLAQGMVNFASDFSSGKTLDYIETEKARVVLLELEKDWWVVASIDLTRLPTEPTQSSSNDASASTRFHYSAREMGHPQLLIQQLRRAHSIFLLLHDFSMSDLYKSAGRSSFCLFLERFWEKFAWNWELLLTGNPIVDIYNGIKLSAGGELGIGVGEEEWGSGEREVLEDFVGRTDGLIDLVVSRFGDSSGHSGDSPSQLGGEKPWLGQDTDPRPTDGVIFSGVDTISRRSVSHVSHWMEWIYRYGDATYGIGRDPNSLRRRKPRRHGGRNRSSGRNPAGRQDPSTPERAHTPGIPRPLVMAAPPSIPEAQGEIMPERDESLQPGSDPKSDKSAFGTEAVMKYLTLGYGSSWSLSTKSASTPAGSPAPEVPRSSTSIAGRPDPSIKPMQTPPPNGSNRPRHESKNDDPGCFVLGPRDDLDTLDDLEEGSPVSVSESDVNKPKTRIVHRTLHVRLGDGLGGEGDPRKLEAVIYVHQPFMFTFLFDANTTPLSSPSLYTSIHHQLGPLQKSLLSSTSPSTAASRIWASESNADPKKRFSSRTQPVHDLVYDPSNLTIRSTIPNIPSLNTTSPSHSPKIPHSPRTPSPSTQPPTAPTWSRIESLAIHHRLLSTYIDTRSRPQELERTCKTSRGWWILWVRIPPTAPSPPPQALSSASSSVALSSMAEVDTEDTRSSYYLPEPQEAFLVRKASDYVSPANQDRMSSGARFFRDLGGSSSYAPRGADTTTPSKLVEGLGLDARRYVEGLLRFNR
ncbi:hypothetical protein N7466_000096 [Penicillium verhagenii]|uniref:uncharacterized protein n=1 Tax=Penicillium verhagenii TaxID=1562060 RepID=UPI002545B850|nr:uncharacterized protein N7466_000096 [Penicillium verhagenii]KAJ5947081.1 hypothetical protein N7466_000096 [Penicillium verhagenii]